MKKKELIDAIEFKDFVIKKQLKLIQKYKNQALEAQAYKHIQAVEVNNLNGEVKRSHVTINMLLKDNKRLRDEQEKNTIHLAKDMKQYDEVKKGE